VLRTTKRTMFWLCGYVVGVVQCVVLGGRLLRGTIAGVGVVQCMLLVRPLRLH
jgi:hypothetical protein